MSSRSGALTLQGSGVVSRQTTPVARSRNGSALSAQHRRWGWLLVAPALLGFVVFTVGPMIASLILSATDWSIGSTPQFNGFQNYSALMTDSLFADSLTATGLYVLAAVPATIGTALFAAVLMNQATRFSGFFRVAFYLPVLVPPVASAVLWLWLFNPDLGLFNTILRGVGLPPQPWLYSDRTSIISLAIMTAWAFGNTALIFLAGLKGVPRELYEAAECDGAGAVRKFWHITLPQISPVILFNLVMGLIAAFQAFEQPFIMTKGGPNNSTYFLVYYLYNKAFQSGQLGYASAIAWVLFILILLTTVLIFGTSRSWVFYENRSQRS